MKLIRIKSFRQVLLCIILVFPFLTYAQNKSKPEVIEVETIPDDAVFVVVEDPATFNGGDLKIFQQWVTLQLEYPEKALNDSIMGKVVASFIVGKDGEICDITIVRGVHPSLDSEVIRVLNLSPLWEPAKQGGQIVKQKFIIPVSFYPGN